ncbi:Unknown protein, partial [Striga hermonthica]
NSKKSLTKEMDDEWARRAFGIGPPPGWSPSPVTPKETLLGPSVTLVPPSGVEGRVLNQGESGGLIDKAKEVGATTDGKANQGALGSGGAGDQNGVPGSRQLVMVRAQNPPGDNVSSAPREDPVIQMTRSELDKIIAEAIGRAQEVDKRAPNDAKKHEKTYLSLINMQQKEGETLRQYVARYTKECIEVPSASEEIKAGGLTWGLRPGKCRDSLAKRPARSFDELLERCSKYVNIEESEADFIRNDKTKTKQVDERPRQGDRRAPPKEVKVEDRFRGPRYEHYKPLNAPQQEILEKMEKRGEDKLLAQPKPLPPPRKFSASKDRYCRYHRDYSHATNFCRELKDEIERLIRAGHLKEFVIKDKERQDDRREGRESGDKRRRTDEQSDRPVKRGIIHMIAGGPTDGDSHRERKRTCRGKSVAGEVAEVQVQRSSATLKFGVDDVQGLVVPHNDALVITAEVASYDVQRVLIDTGSSADIIFLKCLQQMELDVKVEPVHTALYGFSVSEVRPVGEVSLTVALGRSPLRKVKMVRFLVVDASSAYNIILGRPSLNSFQAAISTYCMKIKFPVGDEVGEVTGDQLQSRRCYEHRLNIDLTMKPVKQKRRHFGAELDVVIEAEVEKLLKAGHVLPIQFPEWLSNSVMVRKGEGKWRICIDFRDLNKACPDHYPFPRIDQLVDSTAGCELLSMMDASQGYHQIPLAKEDRKRVSFVTSKGTYCYVVMPFGLKNVGATYQRLVDKMFKGQIGRNMEVYVDDILVKSRKADDHVVDLRETLSTLRRYGMKLNPAKCKFGVRSGKFLGYLVMEKGIEVNPEKVRAVLEMQAPRNLREVQILTGRLAGLSRFIAQSAEKSFPFFKALKKGSRFEWTSQAQQAFERLKEFLAELPLLTKPEPDDTLVVYLSVGHEAISSVLIKEDHGQQKPIYYASRILQGAERRYSDVEKATLARISTARKLCPYFLAHKVMVRTNYPLKDTLGRPSSSGRMVKWAVELGEYNVDFEVRKAIKAQALADFIQECTLGTERGPWMLYVDGSSAVGGSGLGILV